MIIINGKFVQLIHYEFEWNLFLITIQKWIYIYIATSLVFSNSKIYKIKKNKKNKKNKKSTPLSKFNSNGRSHNIVEWYITGLNYWLLEIVYCIIVINICMRNVV
jgi:hypothetical protein